MPSTFPATTIQLDFLVVRGQRRLHLAWDIGEVELVSEAMCIR